MIGYLYTKKKDECFGCGACVQICPRKAISMKEDEEGFDYPVVNELLCIDCRKCHDICPKENPPSMFTPKSAMVGFSVDKEIRYRSASGGAFYAITKTCSKETIVFGAEWCHRSVVRHAAELAELAYERFHKSKYIQSKLNNTYTEVKRYLKQGKDVVFTGTPCQIAGLRAYLGQDYKNLLCVDLICHGVPSGKVLEYYFRDIETKNDAISGIEFRHKYYHRKQWDSKYAQLIYKTGKHKRVDYESSGFLRGFYNGLFFRPSCSVCPYAKQERVSDITIGDAWGAEKIRSNFEPHQGLSLVLVNTPKGKKSVKQMMQFMHLEKVNLGDMVAGNARLRKPDEGHICREDFFVNLGTVPFEKLIRRYIPNISYLKKLGHRIKNIITRGKV